MSESGYSALEAKNSGMVIAWPIPLSRSRLSTIPAIVIDRQEKNAAPRTTTTTTPSSRSGFQVRATPSRAATTTTTTAWARGEVVQVGHVAGGDGPNPAERLAEDDEPQDRLDRPSDELGAVVLQLLQLDQAEGDHARTEQACSPNWPRVLVSPDGWCAGCCGHCAALLSCSRRGCRP